MKPMFAAAGCALALAVSAADAQQKYEMKLAYCVDDPRPQRLPFDLERIMRTEYQIDRFQERYFVIDSFEQLMRETAPDFTPIYARLRNLPA